VICQLVIGGASLWLICRKYVVIRFRGDINYRRRVRQSSKAVHTVSRFTYRGVHLNLTMKSLFGHVTRRCAALCKLMKFPISAELTSFAYYQYINILQPNCYRRLWTAPSHWTLIPSLRTHSLSTRQPRYDRRRLTTFKCKKYPFCLIQKKVMIQLRFTNFKCSMTANLKIFWCYANIKKNSLNILNDTQCRPDKKQSIYLPLASHPVCI
jgi:hypothetical protein